MKDLCNENYRILKKETEEDTEDGKTSHIHGSAEWILFKWPYYGKQCTDSMQSPSKDQQHSSQN